MLVLLLLQAAVQQAPDIELNAVVRARQVTIEKRGDARLTITAEPDAGSLVDVQAPKADGRKTLNNIAVTVRAEARLAGPEQARSQVPRLELDLDPENSEPEAETTDPQ